MRRFSQQNCILALLALVLTLAACGTSVTKPPPQIEQALPRLQIELVVATSTTAKIVVKSYNTTVVVARLDDGSPAQGLQVEPDMDTTPWQFNSLRPGTTYVATVEAIGVGGQRISDYTSFTTLTLTSPSAAFTVVDTTLDLFPEGYLQTTSYRLTRPARVFLYEAYTLEAPWMLIAFNDQKNAQGSFGVAYFAPSTQVFYRLVAKDDLDNVVDSYESVFTTPPM
jgi:hypothetical protein